MTTYIIRPVGSQDIDRLVYLCADHAAFEGSAYFIDGKASELEAGLRLGYCHCLVAEMHNQLVGYTTFMKQFSTWSARHYVYMDCLYLIPEARNLGIGKELIKKIIAYGQSEKCGEIQWQTPATNRKAIRFYHRIGAQSTSKSRFFLDLSL